MKLPPCGGTVRNHTSYRLELVLVEKNKLQRAELKKHIAAIHINNKLSLLQRKIANILLVNAYDELLTREIHTIRTSQLALTAGYDSNDYDTLKDALIGLAETSLQWNILNESGDQEWGVSTMLAEAIIERGVCRYAYSPALRKKLYNPEMYARIHLAIQRKFTSGYGLILYENCARFRGVGSTGWWSIDTFRALLGLTEDEYSQFKDLNKWVIKPAVRQVNENSDIITDPEYRREKRRIVAIRFLVTNNPQMRLRFPLLDQNNGEQAMETGSAPHEEPLFERLQKFGLSASKAKAVLKEHDDAYVVQNLDIVECDYQAGKVANLPAYTAAAIKDDYRSKLSMLEIEHAEKERLRESEARRQQEAAKCAEEKTQLRRKFDQQRLDQVFNRLSPEQRNALEKRFESAHAGNPVFRKWFGQGYEHPVIKSLFRAFASQELLSESKTEEAEFAIFLQTREV